MRVNCVRWSMNTCCITATLLSTIFVLSLSSMCQAQRDVGITGQLFDSCKYAEYLQQVVEQLPKLDAEQIESNFNGIVAVAISLDKTKQWDSNLSNKIEAILSASPNALRYFRATKALLNGDIEGLPLYFDGAPPKYSTWRQGIKVFTSHGYQLAADGFAALYMTGCTGLGTPQGSRETEAGVKALANIDPVKRSIIEDLISTRFQQTDNWYAEGVIAKSAIKLCRKADSNTADTYLDIASKFCGDSSEFLMSAAEDLRNWGKRNLAVKVALKASEANPEEEEIQCEATKLICLYADRATVQAHFLKTLTIMPKPQVREIRIQYMKWLKDTGIQTKSEDNNRIFGILHLADETLIKGSVNQAAQYYKEILQNKNLSLEDRIDAIIGYLGCDPSDAIDELKSMIQEMKSSDTDQKKAAILARWIGFQLWSSIETSFHQDAKANINTKADNNFQVIYGTKQIAQAASLMQQIIDLYPEACLRDLGSKKKSLRVASASLFILADAPNQAMDVLNRKISYKIDPPKGGWKNPPGASIPADALEPRNVSSPIGNNAEKWAKEAIQLLKCLGADSTYIQSADQIYRNLATKSQ